MALSVLVSLPGGTFRMGSDEHYPEEGPAHPRTVEPFAIEEHPVTNAQFGAFVAATGYVTVAERRLDPLDFPGVDPATLVPGALVFTPTRGPVDFRDWRQWWRWQPGAFWRRPAGPDSGIVDLQDHPVVHIAHDDAVAYAAWAGRRLPTEAEWEYAARGGIEGAEFAWGAEARPDGRDMANTWKGDFPYHNLGWGGTSPIGSYLPNGYGLMDMIGNVWERTSDYFIPRHVPDSSQAVDADGRRNLLAPASPTDTMRVVKGGSHLCAIEYCYRYRPAARSAQSDDSAASHLGFRCAASL